MKTFQKGSEFKSQCTVDISCISMNRTIFATETTQLVQGMTYFQVNEVDATLRVGDTIKAFFSSKKPDLLKITGIDSPARKYRIEMSYGKSISNSDINRAAVLTVDGQVQRRIDPFHIKATGFDVKDLTPLRVQPNTMVEIEINFTMAMNPPFSMTYNDDFYVSFFINSDAEEKGIQEEKLDSFKRFLMPENFEQQVDYEKLGTFKFFLFCRYRTNFRWGMLPHDLLSRCLPLLVSPSFYKLI